MRRKERLTGSATALALTAVLAYAVDRVAAGQQMPRDRRTADQRAVNSSQFEEKMAALEREAALEPGDARAHHVVGTAYYEKTRDNSLTADQKRDYLARGLKALDRALQADPDYVEALVYKNIMLRTQAIDEADPAAKQALIGEADRLRTRAMHLQAGRTSDPISEGTVVTPGPPPPPPPPPPGGTRGGQIEWVYATTRYATPGVTPPKLAKNVRPIYAPMAIASGYKGEVVLEATLDLRGKVSEVRVVKSQPVLTQAAIDAIRQWEFDPATMPAPGTVVTVTATFTPPGR